MSIALPRRKQSGLKREAIRDLEETERQRYRARVAKLREKKKRVKAERQGKLKEQLAKCKTARINAYRLADERYRRASKKAREKAKAATIRRKEQKKADRAEVRASCGLKIAHIKQEATDELAHLQAELEEELSHKKEMAAIARSARKRTTEGAVPRHVRKAERKQEADDEVLANIDPSLHNLFLDNREMFRTTPHKARWEAFLEWVEENPESILSSAMPRDEEFAAEFAEWARLQEAAA